MSTLLVIEAAKTPPPTLLCPVRTNAHTLTECARLVQVSDSDYRTGAKLVRRVGEGEETGGGGAGEEAVGEREGAGSAGKLQQEGRLRTKPGRGDATRSMSCSDKLLRWNVCSLMRPLCVDAHAHARSE